MKDDSHKAEISIISPNMSEWAVSENEIKLIESHLADILESFTRHAEDVQIQ